MARGEDPAKTANQVPMAKPEPTARMASPAPMTVKAVAVPATRRIYFTARNWNTVLKLRDLLG